MDGPFCFLTGLASIVNVFSKFQLRKAFDAKRWA